MGGKGLKVRMGYEGYFCCCRRGSESSGSKGDDLEAQGTGHDSELSLTLKRRIIIYIILRTLTLKHKIENMLNSEMKLLIEIKLIDHIACV